MELSKVVIDNYCNITSSICSLERALIEFDSIKVCQRIKSENEKLHSILNLLILMDTGNIKIALLQ